MSDRVDLGLVERSGLEAVIEEVALEPTVDRNDTEPEEIAHSSEPEPLTETEVPLEAVERLNDKGKPMTQCDRCSRWFESKLGIRTHQRSCQANL